MTRNVIICGDIKRWTKTKKHYKIRRGDYEGGIKMATQIAATPILYGKEAERVLREAKTLPSEKSKENASKLINFFKRFTDENEC